MAQIRKIECDTEMKSEAKKFHEVFSRPHHVPKLCPEIAQRCDLCEGEWGKAGSVICWTYILDGKTSVSKQIIEAIDDKNNSTTYKEIEGDLSEMYKSVKTIFQATPKNGGSLVKWTLEYEKLNEDVPDPNTFLELLVRAGKDVDGCLQNHA